VIAFIAEAARKIAGSHYQPFGSAHLVACYAQRPRQRARIKKGGAPKGTHPTLNDGIARPAMLLLRLLSLRLLGGRLRLHLR
jgi:hypothetical protein